MMDEVRSARVLLVASDREQRLETLGWLQRAGAGACWVADCCPLAIEAARLHQPEIALVQLGLANFEGPAVALQMRLCVRHLETVFFGGPEEAGEMAAARDLGLGFVVPFEELFTTLEQMLHVLAERARLRRRLDELEGQIRVLADSSNARTESPRLALPEAERRYRETYIRSLLAETGNRREAARRAGVPYTTLCEIIRKLGIGGA